MVTYSSRVYYNDHRVNELLQNLSLGVDDAGDKAAGRTTLARKNVQMTTL